ncbi:hypothetical protein OG440_40280 (plasmid) [Streptomyces sp. NBC_00637]|uniref:hypothetical protein n=1 Tax=Streptomyces sp. NBC_00637 TaxID=2903667 RepID=UPI003246C91F
MSEEPASGAGDLGMHGAAATGAAEFGTGTDAVHGFPGQGTSELVKRHVEHPTVREMRGQRHIEDLSRNVMGAVQVAALNRSERIFARPMAVICRHDAGEGAEANGT